MKATIASKKYRRFKRHVNQELAGIRDLKGAVNYLVGEVTLTMKQVRSNFRRDAAKIRRQATTHAVYWE